MKAMKAALTALVIGLVSVAVHFFGDSFTVSVTKTTKAEPKAENPRPVDPERNTTRIPPPPTSGDDPRRIPGLAPETPPPADQPDARKPQQVTPPTLDEIGQKVGEVVDQKIYQRLQPLVGEVKDLRKKTNELDGKFTRLEADYAVLGSGVTSAIAGLRVEFDAIRHAVQTLGSRFDELKVRPAPTENKPDTEKDQEVRRLNKKIDELSGKVGQLTKQLGERATPKDPPPVTPPVLPPTVAPPVVPQQSWNTRVIRQTVTLPCGEKFPNFDLPLEGMWFKCKHGNDTFIRP